MPIPASTAVVRRYLEEAWGKCSAAAVLELTDAEVSVFYPVMDKPAVGHAAVRQLIAGHHSVFEVMALEIEQLIAVEQQVVARWVQRVRHIGTLLNVPPSGKELQFTGITIFRLENGRIVDERGEEDFWGIAKSIGAG